MPDRPPDLVTMRQGLERISFDLSIDPKKVIVIAGTNGKGSVCAVLEALLLGANQRVGLYTSPHLVEITERIRINGNSITPELFCKAYQAILKTTSDLALTHFEVLTLMAAWLFFSGIQIPPVHYAIFEVGLGGTWDATNAIPHHYCGITSISYDHQNLLGRTLQEIASNKFGIIQKNAIVVHAPLSDEIKPLANQVCQNTQSRWVPSIPFQMEVSQSKDSTDGEPIFSILTHWGSSRMALPGHRGGENASVALTLFHELGFDAKAHIQQLQFVKWPGRMEKIKLKTSCKNGLQIPCPIYLSGDHNPDGIRSLLQLLPFYRRNHLFILVGVCKDKDLNAILAPLFSLEKTSVFLTETPFRGLGLPTYGSWLEKAKGFQADPILAFHQMVSLAKPGDMALISGSLYLVGRILSWISELGIEIGI
jgi:dihydrofolate synthase/folylpolyglutamate synthase